MSWLRPINQSYSKVIFKTNIHQLNYLKPSQILPVTSVLKRNYSEINMLNSRLFRVTAGAVAASTAYYGITSYRQYLHTTRPMKAIHFEPDSMRLSEMPKLKPTSTITGPTKLDFDLTLFQYCSCPFCCKTRAFLDFFGLNYNIVEVNPVWRQQIKWSKDYRKVPILLVHERANKSSETATLNSSNEDKSDLKIYRIGDSSVIASCLGSLMLSKRKLQQDLSAQKVSDSNKSLDELAKILSHYQVIEIEQSDGTKKNDVPNKYFLMLGDIEDQELKDRETNLAEERYWRDWTDRVLVHSLSPNIYRTLPEATQAFYNFSDMGQWDKHFSTFERLSAVHLGSIVMWLVGKRLKRKYNLKEDVRESLYDNCRQWTKAIGKNRKFMGGSVPNLADLSVYGVLTSIEGCSAFEDVLRETNLKSWYFAMKESCQAHVGKDLLNSI